MGKIWDDINRLVNDVVAPRAPEPDPFDTGLPGYVPTGPEFQGAEPVTPDAVKSALASQGYTPPAQPDPFALDPGALLSVQGSGTSPFTVFDINPALSEGTRGYVSGQAGTPMGTPQTANQFPVGASTLSQLSKLLGIPALTSSVQNLLTYGVYPLGVTYQFNVAAKSLRVDQLPVGALPTQGLLSGLQTSLVNGAFVTNDVRAQQVLGCLLTGCFIQFETNDAPIFIAKPGEVYRLPFTKIYVTVFGSGGRWRLIAGNNASVDGFSDRMAMRQQIHLWDGMGVFDNPMIHPVPFSISNNAPINNTGLGANDFIGLSQGISNNYDTGSGLTRQADGRLVGSVQNKGYKMLWLTSIQASFQNSAVGSGNMQAFIGKSTQAPGIYHVGGLPNFKTVLTTPTVSVSSGAAYLLPAFNYNVPKRVVLAGFDTIDPSQSAVLSSGENLFMIATNDAGIGNFVATVDGYYWPQLVPFNPYPLDPFAFPTN